MISFKEYLLESSPAGNYVCAHCNAPEIPHELLPKSGTVNMSEPHITLMYSRGTNIDPRVVDNVMRTMPHEFQLSWASAECFDAIPKEGERDENKATLVLKVVSPTAMQIHESLKSLGMVHSYPELSPHVTIAYNVDRDEAYDCASRINEWMMSNPVGGLNKIFTTHIESKPIDENWTKKL